MPKAEFSHKSKTFYIAIVGGGPKGTYALDRLIANLKSITSPVEIHIYNRTSFFGSGDVYRSDQPSYLRMNVHKSTIDMWLREEPSRLVAGLKFYDWLIHDAEIPNKDDFPPRALVGRYLEDGYHSLKQSMPTHISLKEFVGEVTDLEERADGYKIIYNDCTGGEIKNQEVYQKILLTTGHPKPKIHDGQDHDNYVPFIYPNKKLNPVKPGSTVAIRGIGLTFVDAALMLTEGRRGQFITTNNQLVYNTSGQEPRRILPFSRSGLPMLPRGFSQKTIKELHFFREDALSQGKHKVDFETEILPLVKQDMTLAYYQCLGEQLKVKTFAGKYNEYSKLEEDIEHFHEQHSEAARFDVENFIDPTANWDHKSPDDHHQHIVQYLEKSINDLISGKATPFQMVQQVWACATPLFNKIYRYGGLKPLSQELVDKKYISMLNRVTYGPPVVNMQKIVALSRANLIYFGMAKYRPMSIDDKFYLIDVDNSSSKRQIDSWINARIPKYAIDRDAGLYKNLLLKGDICLFTNTEGPNSYQPGCLAIDEFGRAIKADGEINSHLSVSGTPTEGVTFDNDALTPSRNNFVSGWATQTKDALLDFND